MESHEKFNATQKGFRSIISLYSIAKKASSNLILHKLYERPSAPRILLKIAIWHPFTIKDLTHKEIRSIFFPLPYEDGSRAVIGVK